jgi:hypothetical protein
MRWYLRLVLFFSVCIVFTTFYPPFTALLTAGLGVAIWLVLRPIVTRFEALEQVSAGPVHQPPARPQPPPETQNP